MAFFPEFFEARAHQKTLATAEKPDMAAINKNIEKMGGLKTEMAKIQTKHHLEMRSAYRRATPEI